MDVNEGQLEAYRDHVVNACNNKTTPLALGKFLGRNPATQGDVSKPVYNDYVAHVTSCLADGLQPDLLHAFLQTYRTRNDVHVLYNRPAAKGATHVDALLGKKDVALAFSDALFGGGNKKSSEEAFKTNLAVLTAAETMNEQGAIHQSQAPPQITNNSPAVPLDINESADTARFNRQARLKLRNFLNTLGVNTIRQAIKRKPGWSGYAHLDFDPRILPKPCAPKTIEHMHAIFKKVFYGSDEHRVGSIEEVKENLKNTSAQDLVQLDRYLSWIQRQSNFEVSQKIITVPNKDIIPNDQLIRKIDRRYRPDFNADFEESESKIRPTGAVSHTEAAQRMGAIRHLLLQKMRESGERCPEASHILVPVHFDLKTYPDAANDEHREFVQRLAGMSGWGPAILTPEEHVVYEATVNQPMIREPRAGLAALAAMSTAAHRGDLASAESILDEHDTHEKRAMLVHGMHSMHVPTGDKVLLDLNGPYWSVRHMADGSDNGYSTLSPGRMAALVRGIANVMDSKEKLSALFGKKKYEPDVRQIAAEALRQIRAPALVKHPLNVGEVEEVLEKTGVHSGIYVDEDSKDIDGWPFGTPYPAYDPIPHRKEHIPKMPPDSNGAFVEFDNAQENGDNGEDAGEFDDIELDWSEAEAKTARSAEHDRAAVMLALINKSQTMEQKKVQEKNETIGRVVTADISNIKDAMVFLPRVVKTAGNTWKMKAHVMRMSPDNKRELINNQVVTMMDGTRWPLRKLVRAEEMNQAKHETITYVGGDPLVFRIHEALAEEPIIP